MADLQNSFQLKWRGDTLIVSPSGHCEELGWDLIDQAALIVLQPIKSVKLPSVVFDLSKLKFVGSVFLSLMLRCYKLVKSRGGEFVLCGANGMATELMRITKLDSLWPIYDSREDALMSLEGDD
jgi:anti-sigma B factor antagonist